MTAEYLTKTMIGAVTERIARKLDDSRKLLLIAAVSMACAAPSAFAQANASQSGTASPAPKTATESPAANPAAAALEYEVASIKPNKSGPGMVRFMGTPDGFSATGITLQMLVANAYGVQNFQISGAPSWLGSERYDLDAKMDSDTAAALKKLDQEQGRLARSRMLQKLLADRCKLTVHTETKDMPVYALVIAKNGPKMQEAKPGDTYPNGFKGLDGVAHAGTMRMGRGQLTAQAISTDTLVHLLSQQLGRTVVDKTGLTGKYDFTLQWTPDESQGGALRAPEGGGPSPADGAAPPESSGPSIFTALQEQLGLKLESQKGTVETIVIDHVEKPSEN
jgi:uncharacterized protein (TIGR03435 family)